MKCRKTKEKVEKMKQKVERKSWQIEKLLCAGLITTLNDAVPPLLKVEKLT